MTVHVLDTSALLALLDGEAGADRVLAALTRDAVVPAVAVAELLGKAADRGRDVDAVADAVRELPVRLVATELDDARHAGRIRRREREQRGRGDLSLADRLVLGCALRLDAVAVTADRLWTEVDIGARLDVIR